MNSPEARMLVGVPWLFGRQGLIILGLVTIVAAVFLATDITFLAGALLLVGLGAHAWATLAFARVTYSRRLSRARAFCGDELLLESTLGNPRPLPLPWVEVWEKLPSQLGPEGTHERSWSEPERVWVSRGVAVWPYQRLRWRRVLHCTHRGEFRLGEVRLRTGDPFGFFERERPWSDSIELLVYPRVVPLGRLALAPDHPSLDVASASSQVTDPTRTATVRDYRAGDPPRLIHWPTTARRGSLQVRVLEPATSLHVSLLIDVRGYTFGVYRDELFELSLSALASIAVFLQAQGAPVALHANTNPPQTVPPGATVAHLQHMLERMARLEPSPPIGQPSWALDDLPRGNTAVLAASEVAPDLERSIGELENAGFRVLLLLASNHERTIQIRRRGTVILTPGCDLAAQLEGRG